MFDIEEKKIFGFGCLGILGLLFVWLFIVAIWASIIGGGICFIFWCLKHFGVI